MPNYLVHFLNVFKLAVKAEDEECQTDGRSARTWSFNLPFSSSSETRVEEEEKTPPSPPPPPTVICELPQDATEKKSSSFLKSKITCTFRAGKQGFAHGCLTGIFFGGSWGMGQYICKNWLRSESGEKQGKGDASNKETSDSDSTVNESIIFWGAADAAVICGTVCALLCSAKAAIFCH